MVVFWRTYKLSLLDKLPTITDVIPWMISIGEFVWHIYYRFSKINVMQLAAN